MSDLSKFDINALQGVKQERHVDVQVSTKPVVIHFISDALRKKVGYCVIGADNIEGKMEALLYHIHVKEPARRKGYARDLLSSVMVHFDTIVTQALTKEGKKLLMNCNFKHEGDGNFRWTKEIVPTKKEE